MFDIDPSMLQLIVGQQDLPRDLPGEATQPVGPGTGVDGRPAQEGNPFGNLFLFIMLALLAVLIFGMLGNRKERKRREQMIASVKKHDKVQTIGGVIGSIVELKPDFVVLKVDESSNTRITFARSAIQQVIKSSNTGQKEKEVEPNQE
jgi:preprotein translocase subunit YajC